VVQPLAKVGARGRVLSRREYGQDQDRRPSAGLTQHNRADCWGVVAAEHGYRRAMDQPVQSMTLQELRDELHRTSPAWESLDLDGVLADGELGR
jgi:hypothetical protein